MIYAIGWSSVCSVVYINEWNKEHYPESKVGEKLIRDGKDLAEFIKASKDDTFLFSLSNYAKEQAKYCFDQKPQFDEWVKKYEMEPYIKFMSAGISNPVHQERKYSIYVVVMQSAEHSCPLEVKGMVK